ncbi:hypothetical protein GDO81_004530 [Engystomops pustulosus]|uniref:Uncharacterized protein n=1 Tax=Engystomops pustulosus TaxID=76066 RepID=A0AAV6ZSX6_ENGPU|nr:hypothetical protein GDO81_004530 [Engystomops pustulosus]
MLECTHSLLVSFFPLSQYKRIRLLKSDHIKGINICKEWIKQQLWKRKKRGKESQSFPLDGKQQVQCVQAGMHLLIYGSGM